jgi:HD-GYP domain-containing protein (c-di-GMP phosphodiesterase class II)
MTPEFRHEIYELSEEDLIVRKDESKPHTTEIGNATDLNGAETQPSPVKQEDPAVEFLSGMGFDEDLIRRAIRKFPVDPDNSRRIDWILSGAAFEELDDNTPQVRSKANNSPSKRLGTHICSL